MRAQPNWKPFENSGTPQRWLQPMEKCKQGRKHDCTFTTLSSSWRCKYPVIGQALRRARLYQRVGQWSKATSDQAWEKNSVQYRNVRSCCCPRIVKKLERKFVLHIVPAGLFECFSESSKTTKWRYPRSQASRNRPSSPPQTKKYKKKDHREAAGNRLRDLPEWLEEFTDNLEDAEVSAIANTSQDSDSERPTKVATRKHSICTHFPKKTEIAKSANEPWFWGLLAGSALAKQYLGEKKSVTWWQQITRFSMKSLNLETITDVLSWYRP